MMLANYKIRNLCSQTTEEEIAACIDRAKQSRRRSGKLLALLDYGHIVYTGRSKNEAIRIRGYLLESFIHTGLSPRALPYVLDELENSRSAYIVAGAAIALRGLRNPYPQLTDYLFKAVRNIKAIDDAITFDTYKPQWPRAVYTTALQEIFKTFQWMGRNADHAAKQLKSLHEDAYFSQKVKLEIEKALSRIEETTSAANDKCCELKPSASLNYRSNFKQQDLIKIRLQDQNREVVGYTEFFSGTPSLLIFFYTRCDNPNRCSLNISRMGQLQEALKKEGLYGKVKIAAITYDPDYDLPMRMKPYCTSRGFTLDEHSRCFRIDEGMDILLAHLKPGVNYNGSILNHHTSELFLLDGEGKAIKRMQGIEWNIQKIIDELKSLPDKNKIYGSSVKSKLSSLAAMVLSAILAFFPKCPLCLAAYLSLFGITQYEFFRFREWMLPLLIALLLVNLFSLFWMSRRRQWFLPFYLSLAGAFCIILAALFPLTKLVAFSGIILIISGSLLSGLFGTMQEKISLFLPRLLGGFYFQKNHFSNYKTFKMGRDQ